MEYIGERKQIASERPLILTFSHGVPREKGPEGHSRATVALSRAAFAITTMLFGSVGQ